MIRATMRHAHAQSQQPHRERGEPPTTRVAPRRTVVHKHRSGQDIAAEHHHQAFTRRTILMVGARLDAQRIARMIVDDCERVATTAAQGEVALEVHLPQLIGLLALEALIRTGMLACALLELAVTPQDLGNRARRRCDLPAVALEHLRDLAPAPGIVAVLANAQHCGFDRLAGARRAVMRAPRPISKTGPALRRVPPKPLVAFGTADAEPRAKLASVRPRSKRKLHELLPLIHDQSLPPRHRTLPRPACLAARVSPMSANAVPHVPSPYSFARGEGSGVGGFCAQRMPTEQTKKSPHPARFARHPPHRSLRSRGEGFKPAR